MAGEEANAYPFHTTPVYFGSYSMSESYVELDGVESETRSEVEDDVRAAESPDEEEVLVLPLTSAPIGAKAWHENDAWYLERYLAESPLSHNGVVVPLFDKIRIQHGDYLEIDGSLCRVMWTRERPRPTRELKLNFIHPERDAKRALRQKILRQRLKRAAIALTLIFITLSLFVFWGSSLLRHERINELLDESETLIKARDFQATQNKARELHDHEKWMSQEEAQRFKSVRRWLHAEADAEKALQRAKSLRKEKRYTEALQALKTIADTSIHALQRDELLKTLRREKAGH